MLKLLVATLLLVSSSAVFAASDSCSALLLEKVPSVNGWLIRAFQQYPQNTIEVTFSFGSKERRAAGLAAFKAEGLEVTAEGNAAYVSGRGPVLTAALLKLAPLYDNVRLWRVRREAPGDAGEKISMELRTQLEKNASADLVVQLTINADARWNSRLRALESSLAAAGLEPLDKGHDRKRTPEELMHSAKMGGPFSEDTLYYRAHSKAAIEAAAALADVTSVDVFKLGWTSASNDSSHGPAPVVTPIPGLYDSLPAHPGATTELAPGLKISENTHPQDGMEGWSGATARVRYADPRSGLSLKGIVNQYTYPRDEDGALVWVLKDAILRYPQKRPDGSIALMPRWVDVPGTPPLVAGKGTPLGIFLELRLMRQLGIGYGSLRHVKIEKIRDFESVVHLEAQRREWALAHPGEEIPAEIEAQMMARTHIVKHAESVLAQSGHRIKSLTYRRGAGPYDADTLIDLWTQDIKWDYAYYADILAKYGLTPEDHLYYDGNVYLEVEPIDSH